ncbi:MAG TPA: hypothetical protein VFZ24_08640 [Longimicrobiales bacterium]
MEAVATRAGGPVAVPAQGSEAERPSGGILRRVGRWWLIYWLRYAEVVGAQWR